MCGKEGEAARRSIVFLRRTDLDACYLSFIRDHHWAASQTVIQPVVHIQILSNLLFCFAECREDIFRCSACWQLWLKTET